MTAEDLPQVLQWRNHPAVRQHMFTHHEIQADEHRRWFERASLDTSRELLIFAPQGVATGFVGFENLLHDSVVEWGFYAAPGAVRGSGRRLGVAALDHAFTRRGRHKVAGRTLAGNARALRLHAALGFCTEGTLREHFFDGRTHHDVVCFGLLQSEWLSIRQTMNPGA